MLFVSAGEAGINNLFKTIARAIKNTNWKAVYKIILESPFEKYSTAAPLQRNNTTITDWMVVSIPATTSFNLGSKISAKSMIVNIRMYERIVILENEVIT